MIPVEIIIDPSSLKNHLDELTYIADKYKSEIGFWSRGSIEQAISRGRLMAARIVSSDNRKIAGFLIFGGVFPNARIQAIAVDPQHLRLGIAQTLLNTIVARLEAEGFLAISAKPARDLLVAQSFYQRNEFEIVRTQKGGQSRKRDIVVREKLLNSPHLFGTFEKQSYPIPQTRSEVSANLWIIDINVLLDLVKTGRQQYPLASDIFAAALDGRVRIAVTSEFSKELERSTPIGKIDPLLEMAKALPRLKPVDSGKIAPLEKALHKEIFETEKPSQAGSPQAHSDCRHLAECVFGNVSAFVTSDGVLIKNRKFIRDNWGLEVVTLEDFHETLSSTVAPKGPRATQGDGFRIERIDSKTAEGFLPQIFKSELFRTALQEDSLRSSKYFTAALDDDGNLIGLLASTPPATLGLPHEITLSINHNHLRAEIIADTLLAQLIDNLDQTSLNLISIKNTPGQILTYKSALQAGFVHDHDKNQLTKIALGYPITPKNFKAHLDRLRLLVDRKFVTQLPTTIENFDELLSSRPGDLVRIEKALSPTLIVSNNRQVCIQPIAEAYAAELLGTSDQTSLLNQFDGAFRSQKIYVSSGRTKNLFKPNQLVLFYESSRTGGRGAIVAAARVDNVVTQNKAETNDSDLRKTVLDSVDRFAAGEEVTLTGFSSVLRFPRPVFLNEMRRLKATGSQNLQTTTVIATEAAQRIFDLGWSNEK
ncbi:MAG: N-acetyltransferase [Roseibium sp.]|uniref:GNAT family N-acetyltransferase n=1 Tax=Roseibium sp. TaxID=1936156 RepID=UPI003D9C01B0